MSRTSLRNTLESLTRDGYDLVLEGVVNVEGGALAAATERFAECDQCDGQEFEKALYVTCKGCGRNPSNYFWIKSGDGDGLYATFSLRRLLEDNEVQTLGSVVIFDSDYEYSKPLMEQVIENGIPVWDIDLLVEFEDLESIDIGTLHTPNNYVQFSDSSWSIDANYAILGVFTGEDTESLHFKAFCDAPGEGNTQFPGIDAPHPRVLIGIDSRYADEYFGKSTMKIKSKETFMEWALTGMVASHVQPMLDIAVWYNYKMNEKQEKYFTAVSWLLQGILMGDDDCKEAIKGYTTTVEDASGGLSTRGLNSASNRLDEIGDLKKFLKNA